MANYNKVILLGNLTRDPQMSYLPSQTPVVEFSLAVNRRWRGQNGEQREETCFIDCRCYGKQAETFNQYMRKGRPVLVEGRLQLDSWEGKDGQKRSTVEVVASNVQFLRMSPKEKKPLPPSGAEGEPTAEAESVESIDLDKGKTQDTSEEIPF